MDIDKTEQIQTALENVAITLAMLNGASDMTLPKSENQLTRAIGRAGELLRHSYQGNGLTYEDVKPVFDVAERGAKRLWDPKSSDLLHKLTIRCVNTVANIQVQDTLPDDSYELKSFAISPLAELLQRAMQKILPDFDASDRTHRAIRAGSIQCDEVEGLRQQHSPQSSQEIDVDKLPRLTNQTACDFTTLRIWVECIGRKEIWPVPEKMKPLLEAIDSKHRMTPEEVGSMARSWNADREELPMQWIYETIEGIQNSIHLIPQVNEKGQTMAQQLTEIIANSCSSQSDMASEYLRVASEMTVASVLAEKIDVVGKARQRVEKALLHLEEALNDASTIDASTQEIPVISEREKFLAGRLQSEHQKLRDALSEMPETLTDLGQTCLDDPEYQSANPTQ